MSETEGPKFEATKLEGLYQVLDGVSWMDNPTTSELSQFSGLDPRTVGKLVKNAQNLNLVEKQEDGGFMLLTSYPFDGTLEDKSSVVKDALLKLPILQSMRQFLSLGEEEEDALRKAATVCRYVPFNKKNFAPLLTWARNFDVLRGGITSEDLLNDAEENKKVRREKTPKKVVAFLSHSSVDKPFIRQLASDLDAAGISVWLDEQRIKVGDSIPDKVSQGLASSDYFLIALSESSVKSEWVKKELSSAMLTEIKKREVHILPLLLDDVDVPHGIADKKYANFASSYKEGLAELVETLKDKSNGE
ncbi:toll/interleukin-1 receptor domain-containing protein [Qipengyuania sp. 1XM1-15A]|uniref:TIR domain-containing protein n=1 Tax=Qipengyuania xiamenensis TaxID=2867237 RepID=UPI001C87BF3A|nr:TIR domain-containing protein [Qipengyuania xiamenensis]MBX7531814.1 toll/interleukin-1 receptor domain-containing protein [Qipengyuania xiamenensis]